jgi:hypothetical protein
LSWYKRNGNPLSFSHAEMSSGKINLFFPPTEKQPNTLLSDHSAVTTASVSAAPSTLINCKEEEKMEEDGGSLSSSRSNTVDLPTDSPEETDTPREAPEPLLSIEPSGPGVCGKRGKESTEESAAITIAVFVRYMVVGRSTQIGYQSR